jgi:hypothetical protein
MNSVSLGEIGHTPTKEATYDIDLPPNSILSTLSPQNKGGLRPSLISTPVRRDKAIQRAIRLQRQEKEGSYAPLSAGFEVKEEMKEEVKHAQIEECRPKTSRHTHMPSPEDFMSYVIPSPERQNMKEEVKVLSLTEEDNEEEDGSYGYESSSAQDMSSSLSDNSSEFSSDEEENDQDEEEEGKSIDYLLPLQFSSSSKVPSFYSPVKEYGDSDSDCDEEDDEEDDDSDSYYDSDSDNFDHHDSETDIGETTDDPSCYSDSSAYGIPVYPAEMFDCENTMITDEQEKMRPLSEEEEVLARFGLALFRFAMS